MSLIKNLVSQPSTALGGTGAVFIDADTLHRGDEKFRIQGINAPEVEKVIKGDYKLGTAGGEQYTKSISDLANEQGFTNITPLLDENGNPQIDDFGRTLAQLTNEAGDSFAQRALESGLFDVNKYTNESDALASRIAEARRDRDNLDILNAPEADAWDQARVKLEEAILEEGGKQRGFKQTALNERQLADAKRGGYGHQFADANVQVRHRDRTLSNDALNPFSDSWNTGWISVTESAYGMLNLLGETTGTEALADIGENGVIRAKSRMQEYDAEKVLDYRDVDGFWSAIEFVGNNAAISVPYMAATIGGAALAPVTGGASLALPASLYTGQVWNEMEGEKNAAIAIGAGVAQATIDRLGLTALIGKSGPPKELMNKAVNALVNKGLTKEAAQAQVAAVSRKELASLVGDTVKIAKEQLKGKNVVQQMLKRTATGAASEGLTEGAQEAIGYLGATLGSDKQFDYNELQERLIAGAVAGSALGGAFTVPGTVSDTAAWADVAYRSQGADPSSASNSYLHAEQEKKKHGRIASIEELAADARARAGTSQAAGLLERVEADKKRRAGRGTGDKVQDALSAVPSLWQGATRNIFTPDLQARSRSARVLADMFGGNLQRVFHGSSFENAKHHRVSIYKNSIQLPQKFYAELTGGKTVNRIQKARIGKQVYSVLNKAIDKKGNFDPSLIPADFKGRDTLIRFQQEAQALADKMHADQKKFNPELGYEKNYFLKYKSLDKHGISKNRSTFEEAISETYKLTPVEARQLTSKILNDDNVQDIDEAFSVVKGGVTPGSHKKRTLRLSEQEKFQEFMEQDPFANIAQAAKAAARYTATQEYVGDNGKIIAQLLNDMQAEGISEAEVDRVAARMQDYIDAESGNYKRPTTEFGQTMQAVQKNFMLVTTLAGLPLATISSIPEIALTFRGNDNIGKGLATLGKEFGGLLVRGMKEVAQDVSGKDIASEAPNQKLKDLGYYDWDVGAATTTGVSEVNKTQQHIYQNFFKYIGLQGFTNFTRALRVSMAGDFMTNKAELIAQHRRSGEEKTREIQQAEEQLRNLGLDVDFYVSTLEKQGAGVPLSQVEEEYLANQTREASYNFVNEAIALPGAANRPLIYQDPRFALFTQFQGFMATVTANHIPKMWGEYVKRGTPALKYNAFALMATMVLLGFASQALKDWLKYGEKTPYLDDVEYLQRGVYASGLLGTGERVLSSFFPLYEQRSDSNLEWAWNTATGESPALSNASRLASGLGKTVEGQGEQGGRQIVKSLPFIGAVQGPVSRALDGVMAAAGWNYKGEQ